MNTTCYNNDIFAGNLDSVVYRADEYVHHWYGVQENMIIIMNKIASVSMIRAACLCWGASSMLPWKRRPSLITHT